MYLTSPSLLADALPGDGVAPVGVGVLALAPVRAVDAVTTALARVLAVAALVPARTLALTCGGIFHVQC